MRTIKALEQSRWPEPIYLCALVMFLNRVFRQEWFNRFLWFLASLIKNDSTLRNFDLFSCRCKSARNRHIFKIAFLQRMLTTSKPYDIFFSRLQAVTLFSWSVEQNARDTKMTTRVTEGARRERHEKRESTRKARENSLSRSSEFLAWKLKCWQARHKRETWPKSFLEQKRFSYISFF